MLKSEFDVRMKLVDVFIKLQQASQAMYTENRFEKSSRRRRLVSR